jgi:hypothetical protein
MLVLSFNFCCLHYPVIFFRARMIIFIYLFKLFSPFLFLLIFVSLFSDFQVCVTCRTCLSKAQSSPSKRPLTPSRIANSRLSWCWVWCVHCTHSHY